MLGLRGEEARKRFFLRCHGPYQGRRSTMPRRQTTAKTGSSIRSQHWQRGGASDCFFVEESSVVFDNV
jgi:hypothetical protein